jgi:hypothetical protein
MLSKGQWPGPLPSFGARSGINSVASKEWDHSSCHSISSSAARRLFANGTSLNQFQITCAQTWESCIAGSQNCNRQGRQYPLELNPSESEVYIPAWVEAEQTSMPSMPPFPTHPPGGGSQQRVHSDGRRLPHQAVERWTQDTGLPHGHRYLLCKHFGTHSPEDRSRLQALAVFLHLHQRIKMATFCTNTRPTYFLRAAKLRPSVPITSALDGSFEQFLASTLSFESGYAVSEHRAAYQLVLQQARLGIKQGGLGLTSNKMVAPAALYTALGWFHRWLTNGHANLLSMQWLQVHSANN